MFFFAVLCDFASLRELFFKKLTSKEYWSFLIQLTLFQKFTQRRKVAKNRKDFNLFIFRSKHKYSLRAATSTKNIIYFSAFLCVSAVNFSFIQLRAEPAAGYFAPWGKDSDLICYQNDPSPVKRSDLLSIAAEKVILFHQNVISPVDGPRSHFRPTSARYMLLAMRRYGFFLGYIKGCDRLIRENKDPWIYRTRTINNVIYKWDPTISS